MTQQNAAMKAAGRKISLALGFVLVFVFQPLCRKWAMKGMPEGQGNPPAP